MAIPTQSDINAMNAGNVLDVFTSEAINIHMALNASEQDWITFPSLWSERLRRQLELPVQNPLPTGVPVYASTYNLQWTSDADLAQDAIDNCGLSYGGQDDAAARCRFLVTQAMERLGLP